MLKAIFILITAACVLSSCGKGRCLPPSFFLGTISFSDTESDSIILRRFNKGANFSTQLDSLVISRNNTDFDVRHDTILTYHFDPNVEGILLGENDYIIFLPKVNRVFKLTDIKSEKLYSANAEKSTCYNNLISYNIDGQVVSVTPASNFIFIRK